MLYIDYLAYNNKFKDVSIAEKILLMGGGLVLAVAFPSVITATLLIVIMHGLMIFAGIPLRYVVNIWMIPLPFIVLSLLTSMVSISLEPVKYLTGVKIGHIYLGITNDSFFTAKIVFFRSIAAISCMYALALTTPMACLISYVCRHRWLKVVGEITLLTYRFIFVVIETASCIYTAQQARLGYQSWRIGLRSVGLLAANLGRTAFITSQKLYIALQSRNYSGKLIFRSYQSPVIIYRVIIILLGLVGLFFTTKL